jgi:putative transposase
VEAVNTAMTEAERESIRTSIRRNRPLGTAVWVRRTAEKLGLESSLRPPGRPPGSSETGDNYPGTPKR